MSQPPPARIRRTAAAALAVGIGIALGFAGYHAARAADLAGLVPSGEDLPEHATTSSTAAAPSTTSTTTSTSTTSTTSTTVAPTTTAPPPPPTTTTTVPAPPSYRTGDEGPEVAAVQARLQELGFWLPTADGHFGSLTAQAVMAFQKHAGLSRDGIAGPATLAALDAASPVVAREGGDHVELDLERQLLVVVRGGRTLAFNTSTGTRGWETPTGRFTVTREIDGVRHAPLGDLYRPKYFNGGIAVHGSPSIPGHPASHGCARVHDAAMDLLWAGGLMPVGTPVWVY